MTSPRTTSLRFTVAAPDLAAALDAVRFAAGSDPELPMLAGVLFDVEPDALRAVATDRYRMAVARVGGSGWDTAGAAAPGTAGDAVTGTADRTSADAAGATAGGASEDATTGEGAARTQVIVPSPLADAMRALLGAEGSVHLTVEGNHVALEAGTRQATGPCLDHDFPDYRRLVRLPAGRRGLIDVPAFRRAVETGPVRIAESSEPGAAPSDLSVLKVTGDGTIAVCAAGDDAPDNVAVNREFLLQALAAGARDRLILELGAPTAPMAVRRTDTEETFSVLMPVRLDK